MTEEKFRFGLPTNSDLKEQERKKNKDTLGVCRIRRNEGGQCFQTLGCGVVVKNLIIPGSSYPQCLITSESVFPKDNSDIKNYYLDFRKWESSDLKTIKLEHITESTKVHRTSGLVVIPINPSKTCGKKDSIFGYRQFTVACERVKPGHDDLRCHYVDDFDSKLFAVKWLQLKPSMQGQYELHEVHESPYKTYGEVTHKGDRKPYGAVILKHDSKELIAAGILTFSDDESKSVCPVFFPIETPLDCFSQLTDQIPEVHEDAKPEIIHQEATPGNGGSIPDVECIPAVQPLSTDAGGSEEEFTTDATSTEETNDPTALKIKIEMETMKLAEPNTQNTTPVSVIGLVGSQDDHHQEASAVPGTSGHTQAPNHIPSEGEVLRLIALNYLSTTPPRCKDDHDNFLAYMKEMQLIFAGVSEGSLLITVICGSLQILEGLWEDYSSGHLSEVVQNCFVTEEILTALSLSELTLKTTILEEEYKICKAYFAKEPAEGEHGTYINTSHTSSNSGDGNRPVVVVGGGRIINRFWAFLERLSLEIQEDQLEGLKFLLQGRIPLSILETCHKPRQLFHHMIQESLLGEDNLDNLEQLFKEVQRSDLVVRVRVFKQSYMEMEMKCELPAAVEIVSFFIGAQRTDHKAKETEGKLVRTMCSALNIDPSEIRLFGSDGVGDNWFNLTFEIPNRKEVLDALRWAAIEKKPWLGLCGVKAVTIGSETQILIQPVTRSLSVTAGTSHNGNKLDLILLVDCATSNPALLGNIKTQLSHLVSVIFHKDFHLRLALVSYQNHQSSNPLVNNTVYTQNFTDDRNEMEECIKNLRCFGKGGTTKGLADGLAAALTLSEADVDNDNSKCRKDAIKMCILLPMVDRKATLEIFKCEHGHDVMKLCRQLAQNSVTLYTVAVAALSQPVPRYLPDLALELMANFFTGISLSTGGQFIPIRNIKLFSEVVMYAIDEGVSMENLFGTAYDIVFEEVKKGDNGDVDLENLANVLKGVLNERVCRVSLILLDTFITGPKSKLAKMFAFDEDIDSACTTFQCAMERLRRSNIVNAPETPSDVDMEVKETESQSPQVSLFTNHEITTDVSERMVWKVGLRKRHYRPS